MKTYNTNFVSIDELKFFLKEYIPTDKKNILLQMFIGNNNSFVIKNIISIVKQHNSNIKIIGTGTDGEVIENSILTSSVVLSFTIFEKTELSIDYVKIDDSFNAGVELAKKIVTSKTKAVIIFADGLHTNGEEFLKGFESINNSVLIAGGLSGDNSLFIDTLQVIDETISDKLAVAVALNSDDLILHNGYNFGWRGIGRDFTITKSNKNIVEEIDNKPILKIYEEYLGKPVTNELPRIGVEIPFVFEKDGIKIARACVGRDKNKLIFAGNLEEGTKIRFSMPSFELNGEDIKNIASLSSYPVETIFIYSCMARRKSIKKQILVELEVLSELSNLSGFFTYGEFFSKKLDNGKYKYFLFNETSTFLTLSEGGSFINRNVNLNIEVDKNDLCLLKEALINFINKTTDELYEINHKLEERVQKEVEENIRKNLLLQQQSKQAQMGEMISMIAHQWRQPLNVIALHAANLELDIEFGELKVEEVMKVVKQIKEQTQKMSKIIDSFTDFIKPDVKKEVFSIKQTIKKALDIMEAQLKARGIDIIINFSDEEIHLCGYQTLFEQVIINLISNARDAFETSKQDEKLIKISCKREKKVFIYVQDNVEGGIPKKIQDRIFNPYFTTKGTKGTGLGLYMSKQIIEDKFKGRIYFKSSKRGTNFIIELDGESLDIQNCK